MSHRELHDPEVITPIVKEDRTLTHTWEQWLLDLTGWQTKIESIDHQENTAHSIAAATVAEVPFVVAGVQVGDVVLRIEKPTHQAGLSVVGGRVDVDGTVQVEFVNPTAGAIVTTNNEYYKFIVLKG